MPLIGDTVLCLSTEDIESQDMAKRIVSVSFAKKTSDMEME